MTQNSQNKLGTFGGVFTPSILTILGVIMFMRAGYVVGEAGILQAILILIIAKTITTLTSLSISAVSTNTPVSGGGAYFLISRALGPEFGGAIGIALFFAQARTTFAFAFFFIGLLVSWLIHRQQRALDQTKQLKEELENNVKVIEEDEKIICIYHKNQIVQFPAVCYNKCKRFHKCAAVHNKWLDFKYEFDRIAFKEKTKRTKRTERAEKVKKKRRKKKGN